VNFAGPDAGTLSAKRAPSVMRNDVRTEMLTRLAQLERDLSSVKRDLGEARVRAPLPAEPFQAVRFALSGDDFALPSRTTREIVRYARLARVPGVTRAVQGVLNLRGEPVPVLDVAQRLGMGEIRIDLKTPILIAAVHGWSVGLLVERVLDVVTVDPAALKAPSTGLSGGRFVAAVGNLDGKLVQVVDIESLASPSELEELEARLSEAPLVEHGAADTLAGGWE
jgi:purine-binding chemotaxis protein CheW